MDTTKTNIEMCRTAEEIQASKPLPYEMQREGIIRSGMIDGTIVIRGHFFHIVPIKVGWTIVWLPRQDELQEMWEAKLPESLPEFTDYAVHEVPGQFTSMEQLWLAFVMKEKYGKIWNGTEWVKA